MGYLFFVFAGLILHIVCIVDDRLGATLSMKSQCVNIVGVSGGRSESFNGECLS